MTVTIKAVMDFDLGAELGARFYNQTAPTVQVGADVILTQSARVTHYASGALADITTDTYYDVDMFLSSGGTIIEASPLASTSICVAADGGVYWLGQCDATLANQVQIIADIAALIAGGAVSGVVVTASDYGQTVAGVLQLKEGVTELLTVTGAEADIVSDLSAGDTKVFFSIRDNAGRAFLKCEGTVVTPTGTQVVTFQITPAQARKLRPGNAKYDVVALYGYAITAAGVESYTSLELLAESTCFIQRLELEVTT